MASYAPTQGLLEQTKLTDVSEIIKMQNGEKYLFFPNCYYFYIIIVIIIMIIISLITPPDKAWSISKPYYSNN